MPTQLLNLRHVPDDEADEIRALLDAQRIAYYETAPNRWGISAGAIWIRDERDAQVAKSALSRYQEQRRERVRAEHAAARLDGSAPTWWSTLRAEPMRVIAILIAIACVIALAFWPLLLAAGT